jgi:CyaY protein
MTDSEYLDRAEALLAAVERNVDRINETTDADLDVQRVGGMVTLVFADRSQIVINLQKPLHEVWMATRFAGYHYKWTEGVWTATRDGSNFIDDLNRDASAHAQLDILFAI